jgi:predicted phage baseplate assembly protein
MRERDLEVRLDPRHYQDLVDESRTRVGRRCPEWTDHNVSDPGMTLIDQFAWMFDILLYRVNRLPELVHEALLALVGVRRKAAVPAVTKLRFRLARPPESTVVISGGSSRPPVAGVPPPPPTEVATVPTPGMPAVVFQVSEDAAIPALSLTAAWVSRAGGGPLRALNVLDGFAILGATDDERRIFSLQPVVDDALYLGFDQPIKNLVLQVHADSIPARGSEIDPDEVPLQWEVVGEAGQWLPAPGEDPVEVLVDTAGGFNYATGYVELQIPERGGRARIGGVEKHWLRCRPLVPQQGEVESYYRSPQVSRLTVKAIGVLARAQHAMLVTGELIGVSDGTPGQTFRVLHAPTLELADGETLQVEERTIGADAASAAEALTDVTRWRDWEPRESLHGSGREDKHFLFDTIKGEVSFGIAIQHRGDQQHPKLPSGWFQHGAIPPAGARLRMSRYHHGGGEHGNVKADTLTVLRTPIPGVASVTNPEPAIRGIDAETLAAAQHRAADELRMGNRVVTADDYVHAAVNADNAVARAFCISPEADMRRRPPEGGPMPDERQSVTADPRMRGPRRPVALHILPTVARPQRHIPREQMQASPFLRALVVRKLEGQCVIGTSVHVSTVALREVTVVVEATTAKAALAPDVKKRIEDVLYRYVNPYIGGNLDDDGDGEGWGWGQDLQLSELRVLVGRVEGVDRLTLRAYETTLPAPAGTWDYVQITTGVLELQDHELLASGEHQVKVDAIERR